MTDPESLIGAHRQVDDYKQFSHRNGESVEPTEPGYYWVDDGPPPIQILLFTHKKWYWGREHCYLSNRAKFYGPIVKPQR